MLCSLAVEEAKAKGIEANQALKDRQEDLAQLKEEAEHYRAEVKEAMAKVRAEGRATSAPAIPSRRLRADLESGVHARAAKKADKDDKDRQRAASHRASTGRDRAASWRRFEHATFGQDDPGRWDQDDMGDIPEPPKPRKLEPKRHRGGHHRSERRRQDEARKKENLARMSEMKGERTPPWVHDRYEKSETESVSASGEDGLVNRLDRLQQDPAVRHKLDKVLKEAYEETYGEPLDLDSPEMVESDFDVPMADEPAPGMEDVVHHWEIAQKEIMLFKDLHEKSKTVSRMGHPYVKCQACGKALNSMSIASFWQHVESKQCYPQRAVEFWKKEHRQMKVEKESSSKQPMDDSEALSEKKLQQMAKEKEEKKRKDIFSGHLERFKKASKEDVKPEVKRIPKRPEEKQAEKKEPIVLRSRSPSRRPEGRRADSAQAPKGMGKVSVGAKRFLTRAVLEAAKDVRRHAKKPRPMQEEKEKKEEKVTSSPK